jgi:hypothetical protein
MFKRLGVYVSIMDILIPPTSRCPPSIYKHINSMDDPRFIYLLGFFWGDGYIHHYVKTGHYLISAGIVKEDGEMLKPTFEVIENLNCYERRPTNRRPIIVFRITSRVLYDYLMALDYRSKASSPDKVISKIPEHLKHYWFRGLFDADGHARLTPNQRNPRHHSGMAAIYGPYDQDWSYIERLCERLEIKCTIRRRHRNTGSSSEIQIMNKVDVVNFLGYLYQGYEQDGIGLKRKQEKRDIIKASILQTGKLAKVKDYSTVPHIPESVSL